MSTVSLRITKSSGTKQCPLCAVERMVTGHNFNSGRCKTRTSVSRVNCAVYAPERHGSYCLHYQVRKRGSVEAREKAKNRAVVLLYGMLYFFVGARDNLAYIYPQQG